MDTWFAFPNWWQYSIMDIPSAGILRWRWHGAESHVRHGEWDEILLHHYKVLGFGGEVFVTAAYLYFSYLTKASMLGYFEGPGWKRSHSLTNKQANKQTVSNTTEPAQEASTSVQWS